MTTPFEHGAEPMSQEAFEDALIKEHQAGRLALHRIVPAVYGVWVEGAAQRTEQDHVHLPGGTSLDYPTVFEPETHRLDVLLSCPTQAQQVTMLSLMGAVRVLCLN